MARLTIDNEARNLVTAIIREALEARLGELNELVGAINARVSSLGDNELMVSLKRDTDSIISIRVKAYSTVR